MIPTQHLTKPVSQVTFEQTLYVITYRMFRKHKRILAVLEQAKLNIRRLHNHAEVKIPVPWGHVSGKWWGPQDIRPILITHGWQDNSGSFDRLIPLLPKNKSYLAIDYPGHGYSSHIPKGVPYNYTDNILLVNRFMSYFQWPKVSLMGHSMGAVTNAQYSMMFPETVDFLICLDGLKPYSPYGDLGHKLAKNYLEFLKYEALHNSEIEPPSYTEQELIERLHNSSFNSISLEFGHYVLKRNILPSKIHPNKFYLSRDVRLKAGPPYYWGNDHMLNACQQITSPVFLSQGVDSLYFEFYKAFSADVNEIVRKKCKAWDYHEVSGTHHVHLNNPEELGALITDFLKKYDVENRQTKIKHEISAM